MRMSCNGCRVLRKGCPDDCTLRPCLQWLKSPESEANATLFLAKFYGRAGLINLINAGPTHLRPQIFVSLLYEACGRIVNPVEGSVGLMCSGDWPRCQAAVEAVLQGGDSAPRSKDSSAHSVRRVRPRNRFKRSAVHGKTRFDSLAELVSDSEAKFTITGWDSGEDLKNLGEEVVLDQRARSHDSSSVETVEPALAANRDKELVRRVRPEPSVGKIGLELTLGPNPSAPALHFYSDRDF